MDPPHFPAIRAFNPAWNKYRIVGQSLCTCCAPGVTFGVHLLRPETRKGTQLGAFFLKYQRLTVLMAPTVGIEPTTN